MINNDSSLKNQSKHKVKQFYKTKAYQVSQQKKEHTVWHSPQ